MIVDEGDEIFLPREVVSFCEMTESISEKFAFVDPNTFRIAVFRGKSSIEMPLLLAYLYESR